MSVPDSGISLAIYCVVDSICPKKIFDEVPGTGPFTDATSFTLFSAHDGRHRINGHSGESFADACIVGRDRLWSDSDVVLGGISHGEKSQWIEIAGIQG